MKFWEKIKAIFFKKKIKALPSKGLEIDKIVLTTINENDPEKVIDALKNYGSEMQSESIVHIISHLPLDKRFDAINLCKEYINTYDLAELALRKLDYTGKMAILEQFQDRLDLEDIYKLFNNIPPDKRSVALSKCIERLDSLGIAEIIKKYVPLYDRLDCLNNYSDKLDGFSKAEIIESLDDERKISALTSYAEEINKTDLYDIVSNTETNNILDVLNIVYEKLTSKQIMDIIQYYVPNEKKLETMYKCCNKLDSSTISDLIKYAIPDNQKEEALIAMQNRMQSNNIGEILQFCVKTISALEKVQHNLDAEDVEYFKNHLG